MQGQMEQIEYQDEMAEIARLRPNLAAQVIRDFAIIIKRFNQDVHESGLNMEGGEAALARLLVEHLRTSEVI